VLVENASPVRGVLEDDEMTLCPWRASIIHVHQLTDTLVPDTSEAGSGEPAYNYVVKKS
jgi:hypothetical protein